MDETSEAKVRGENERLRARLGRSCIRQVDDALCGKRCVFSARTIAVGKHSVFSCAVLQFAITDNVCVTVLLHF